jgi:uncharacterized RDD family membrane protein YckC
MEPTKSKSTQQPANNIVTFSSLPEPLSQNVQPIVTQPTSSPDKAANVLGQQPTSRSLVVDDGRRVLAALADILIIGIFLRVTTQGELSIVQVTASSISFGPTLILPSSGLLDILALLELGSYFVLFEFLFGATLGKLIFGIRVKNEDGSKIGIGSSLIRNFLRIVDGFPYVIPYLLGMIVMATNSKRQRLGDKAAHTLVVRVDRT